LAEQKLICQEVRKAVLRLDELMTATVSAIARLTEYRTALITAATTSKIDVRNVKIPEPVA
jgi:type I restriction enzyme S subunit